MRSILLYLLAKNIPLGHWQKYSEEEALDTSLRPEYWGEKYLDNAARKIVNALSQRSVAERLAKEWEILPPFLRMRITKIANEARGFFHISNNVSKGIGYADKLLDGKILAREVGPTERTLRIVDGRKVSVERRINPAIAGAQRAFGGLQRPPNFASLSKQERKQINQRLAAERRETKRR